MTDPYTTEDSRRSVGERFADVSSDLSTLLRQEVALAKAEIRESATRAGKGAGLFAGAGVAGHMVLLFLSVALWWALGAVVNRGWSAVIVAAVWAIIAVVLTAMGRTELKSITGMQQTAETVRKIPKAAVGNEDER